MHFSEFPYQLCIFFNYPVRNHSSYSTYLFSNLCNQVTSSHMLLCQLPALFRYNLVQINRLNVQLETHGEWLHKHVHHLLSDSKRTLNRCNYHSVSLVPPPAECTLQNLLIFFRSLVTPLLLQSCHNPPTPPTRRPNENPKSAFSFLTWPHSGRTSDSSPTPLSVPLSSLLCVSQSRPTLASPMHPLSGRCSGSDRNKSAGHASYGL